MMSSTIPQTILRPIRIELESQQQPATVVAAAAAAAEPKSILTERFKTKMCNNFEKTGSCPYVHRCMFAHGEHDLRTKAQNVADKLFTEEAIKAFQRTRAGGSNAASPSAARRTSPLAETKPAAAAAAAAAVVAVRPVTPVPAPSSPVSSAPCYCATCSPPVRRTGTYRHDPYNMRAVVAMVSSMMVPSKRASFEMPHEDAVLLP